MSSEKTFAGRLFSLAVLAAALQDLPMSIWAMLAGLPTQPQKYVGFEAVTSFYWIKAIKYLIFMFTLFVAGRCVFNIEHNRRQMKWLAAWFLLACLPSMMIAAMDLHWAYFIGGLKAWLPLLALIIGLAIKREDLDLLAKVLDWMIYLNLIVSIFQQIHGHIVCPIQATGCISLLEGYRSTGSFVEPNTMATLVIARLILMLDQRPSITISFLGFVLVILSGSITGMFVCVALLPFIYFNEIRSGKIPTYLLSLFVVVGFGLLVYFRGIHSLGERFAILGEYFSAKTLFFGIGFGAGTLSMESLGHLSPQQHFRQFPTDSLIASLMAQGGAWLTLIFGGGLLWLFIKANLKVKVYISTFALLGVGMVISEVWPVNIILIALIGKEMAIRNSGHINRSLA